MSKKSDNTRELLAIVFSDIKGYTQLMQENETLGLTYISKYQKLHDDLSRKHQGTIVQYYGDACLMTFKSASNALECAEELQLSFGVEPKVPVRIGIHQGEVVHRDGNVFGNAVNIASRVESMGTPMSVLFSENIVHSIKSRGGFKYESVGAYEFKNVNEPIELFASKREGLVVPKVSEMEGKLKEREGNKRSFILPLIGVLLLGVMSVYYGMSSVLDTTDQEKKSVFEALNSPTPNISRANIVPLKTTNKGMFSDPRDKVVYKWEEYKNGQKWMVENVRWKTSHSHCYNDENRCEKYGRLYNWADAKRVCPQGWRLPKRSDWTALFSLLGSEKVAYESLKNGSGNGFNLMLGGSFNVKNEFKYLNGDGNYWTSEEKDNVQAWYFGFNESMGRIDELPQSKKIMFSCRCIATTDSENIGNTSANEKKNSSIQNTLQSVNVTTVSTQKNDNNDLAILKGQILLVDRANNSEEDRFKDIIQLPLNIDADLKVGKRKPNADVDYGTIRLNGAEKKLSLTHNGNAHAYAVTSDRFIKLGTNVSELVFGIKDIDADLKIGKKKPSASNSSNATENLLVILTSEMVKESDLKKMTEFLTEPDFLTKSSQMFTIRKIFAGRALSNTLHYEETLHKDAAILFPFTIELND